MLYLGYKVYGMTTETNMCPTGVKTDVGRAELRLRIRGWSADR